MTGDAAKYLVLFLNSVLETFAFKRYYMGTELGDKGYRYKKAFIKKLPIPKISNEKKLYF